jgi:long-chain fatty acid transport protein
MLAMLALTLLLAAPPTWATNGDNLIGVGPVSRAMGGVGVAAPQDAISAVFANPAAMCFGPYCPSSEFNFAGTAFMPDVETKITNSFGTRVAESESNVYPIPAIGLSVPIGNGNQWRFGIAAYGVTGLGVDYRGTSVDDSTAYGPNAPYTAGEYTNLQIMKFAPAVAWQPLRDWSFGLAVHIDYASLDLRGGTSPGYAFGVQPGAIWKATENLSLGLSYISPQSAEHEKVIPAGFGGGDLKLEAPQQLQFGGAYSFLDGRLLIEADAKWINWSSADGYDDFDWNDQWIFGIGGQFEVIDRLFLRAGYNFGSNPVEEHNGWDGAAPGGVPNDIVNVQGTGFPRYYYETFRIVGFPAIVEQHFTAGVGYAFTEGFRVDLGFMYAPEKTITERGTDLAGAPATIESKLSETSLDFGLTWRF